MELTKYCSKIVKIMLFFYTKCEQWNNKILFIMHIKYKMRFLNIKFPSTVVCRPITQIDTRYTNEIVQ